MRISKDALGIFITYSIVILVVLFWSGLHTEKTLIDDYVVQLDSVILPVNNQDKAIDYYTHSLKLPKLKLSDSDELSEFQALQLPAKRRIFLHSCNNDSTERKPITVIKVRTGFSNLHEKLVKQSNQLPITTNSDLCSFELAPGQISQIFTSNLFGQQFLLSDPDGNKLLFYRGKRRLL